MYELGEGCAGYTINYYLQGMGMRKEIENKGEVFVQWKNICGMIIDENVDYTVIYIVNM